MKRHKLAERGPDLYPTCIEALPPLVQVETLPHHIWEPCCGPGVISRFLESLGHHVYSTDLNDFCYGIPRYDFLMDWQSRVDVESIVTNPPYSLANQFVRHALFHAPKVIMLLPLNFLASEVRTDILENSGLKTIHIFRNRLPMMHRHGWIGKRNTSQVNYAWFVWERGWTEAPRINRISWQPLPELAGLSEGTIHHGRRTRPRTTARPRRPHRCPTQG